MGAENTLPAMIAELPDDPQEFSIECHRRGWSDGLPVIPATPERVRAMLAATDRDPLDVVGVLAPRRGLATVEAVAVNAVMAGCDPEHFACVLAAVAATADEAFNLDAVNATTHPVAMFVLASGPAARAAGIHAGSGCFGPGFRANLSIGRALRLVQLTVAGAWPGPGDKAEQGTPAKIAFCAAEREDASPWPPYITTRGLPADAFAVTVGACEGPHNIQDHQDSSAEGILKAIAGTMLAAGSNNINGQGFPFLAIGPEHAATIAGDGLSREDVQRYVWEHARFPAARLTPEFSAHIRKRNPWAGDDLPVIAKPEDLQVIVAGGPGKHSSWMPTFGYATRPVTVSWAPK